MDLTKLSSNQSNLPEQRREELQTSLIGFSKAVSQDSLERLSYLRSLSVAKTFENPIFLKHHSAFQYQSLLAILAKFLDNEMLSMNFKNSLSTSDVILAADMIIEKYAYETLDDIALAFKEFKMNNLSLTTRSFFKISAADILAIVDCYLMEVKIPAREQYNRKPIYAATPSTEGKASPEEVSSIVRKYLAQKRKEREPERPSEKTVLNDYNTALQAVLVEFRKMPYADIERLIKQ